MPKKKSINHVFRDITINDSANSVKPVRTIRKALSLPEDIMLASWEDINNDTEINEEIAEDGSKKLSYKKKKPENIHTDEGDGIEYPEIVFYLISRYIKPECIGQFALINKAAYAVTKNKSFWMLQFKRYCEKHPKLPNSLRSDSYRAYGLQQTVIRSLYVTYDLFIKRALREDVKPHSLVSRVCVNSWFSKGFQNWKCVFKLKRRQLQDISSDKDLIEELGRIDANPEEGIKALLNWKCVFKLKRRQLQDISSDKDLIEELGRIDANPEEGIKALLVTCKDFQDVPPLMGMTLTAVNMTLSHGYRHHKLYLGFNTSQYAIKGIVPEREVILDGVIGTLVCDWWHPQYPQTSHLIPRHIPPLLRKNFFDDEFV